MPIFCSTPRISAPRFTSLQEPGLELEAEIVLQIGYNLARCEMPRTIDTTWDQLPQVLGQENLPGYMKGKAVRVFIDDDLVVVRPAPESGRSEENRQEWLRRFHEWVESHPPLPHEVDDSRDTIYSEAVRDLG
jgi:hypothetical protein